MKQEQQLLPNRELSQNNNYWEQQSGNYWSTGNEVRTTTIDQQGMKLEQHQLLINRTWSKLEQQLLINREWSQNYNYWST